MKKKFGTALVIMLIIFSLSTATCFAATDEITILLDDTNLWFEVPPMIENGTTLVPMRNILEPLGYHFIWFPEERSITVYNDLEDGRTIRYTQIDIDSYEVNQYDAIGYTGDDNELYTIESNEHTIPLQGAPARLINGRTMVPVRFIAELSGCNVKWNAELRCIFITSPGFERDYEQEYYDSINEPNEISDEQRAINEKYTHIFDDGENGSGGFQ